MALIDCPECGGRASDRAQACPHCGFPIATEIEEALSTVTGHDRIRTARQRAAAHKLKSWSEGYLAGEPETEKPRTFLQRHQSKLIILTVAILVTLQLYVLYHAIYE